MSAPHNFQQSLARSKGYDEAAERAMQKYLGTAFSKYRINPDIELDKKGVDSIVTLTNGKELYLDLKVDHYDSEQVTMEMWSNKERGKPGWLADTSKLTDLIVYIKPKLNLVLVIPFLQLQHWFRQVLTTQNVEFLKARSKTVRNEGYTTTILLFTLEELQKALGTATRFSVGGAA